MNICIEGEFSEETSLMSDLNECLGNDIDIKIERVPDIPLLASGKRKLVVNKYLQKVNNG